MANVLLSDGIWPWERPPEPSEEEKRLREALQDNYEPRAINFTGNQGCHAVNSVAEELGITVPQLFELAKKYHIVLKTPPGFTLPK